ncbi:InlB B-repeat-containing protein [Anaerostipes caccae]|uniref:InlB B-repeat-containing protein n=1 Tax=Anaerostipes caccae TaxID=105841 RepID=UPI002670D113|nr:InlB B-repeat-containing protein [Anaerostipes caccae]
MKKQWKRCMAAAALTLALGIGSGPEMLRAMGTEQEMPGKSGGGISGLTEEAPGKQAEAGTEKVMEKTETSENRKTVQNQTLEPDEKELKGDQTKTKKKTAKTSGDTAENGQTILDVSEGDVKITKTGATVGGVSKDDGSLNPKGYWITGTTTAYNVVVEKGVKTEITLCDVNITCDKTKMDCINVSHSDVTITLKGQNELLCKSGNSQDGTYTKEGAALAKDGEDGQLTIQCEFSKESGHKCDNRCGRLIAKGKEDLYHGGAIGNTFRNANGSKGSEAGFSNFTIKGGNIEAKGGYHSPGIGGTCNTSNKLINGGNRPDGMSGKTSNIRIMGGNIKAEGNYGCAGIGGGVWNIIDGLYITGGKVEATGGKKGPGIGSVSTSLLKDIVISGGDTVVIAKGDEESGAPGIGKTNYSASTNVENTVFQHVAASPDNGYQGYVQDGESMDSYTFMEGTPFKKETDIRVGKFYTAVYFGPFRDENTVESSTNEQIGANHVISKTGGKGFTKDQLKELTKVNARDKSGNPFSVDQIRFVHEEQIEAINKAKTAGKTGDYPLTFCTANGTEVTVQIYLRKDGTDAVVIDPDDPVPTIGANDFEKDTGGDGFTEEQLKIYGELKGKDKDGTTIDLDGFTVDPEQMEQLNQAKTAGKSGTFDLTYTSNEGAKVTVQVTLVKYDAVEENQDPDNPEMIKGMDVISRTGGSAFSEAKLKELTMVKAFDKDGREILPEDLKFSESDQLQRINGAKTKGETGNFDLTMETPDGTKVTVKVCLRDSGSDGAGYDPEKLSSFIGANDAVHETGGEAFTKDELRDLCRVKAKDPSRNNVEAEVQNNQWETLNKAKESGKTGTYPLTFYLEDGTKAQVKITLTGDHKVKFDSNGGYDTPVTQTVRGGNQVVEPKDPKRDGYEFMGWYYTDENGKEVKWDFSDPVHQNMTLKAKWKKSETEKADNGTSEKVSKKKTDQKKMRTGNTKRFRRKTDQQRQQKQERNRTLDGYGSVF